MKKIVRNFFDKFYNASQSKADLKALSLTHQWNHSESLSLQYLLNLLGSNNYIADTKMAMSPVTICHILNEIVINKKKTIIEFGSGNSTVFIAKLIQSINREVEFISVDDNPAWIEILQEDINKKQLSKYVQLVYAPVKEQSFDTALCATNKWYDINYLYPVITNKQFDLIIVDGPKGNLCKYSRYPAIPFLKKNLDIDCYTIFLDDTNRAEEQKIMQIWGETLGKVPSRKGNRYTILNANSNFISRPR